MIRFVLAVIFGFAEITFHYLMRTNTILMLLQIFPPKFLTAVQSTIYDTFLTLDVIMNEFIFPGDGHVACLTIYDTFRTFTSVVMASYIAFGTVGARGYGLRTLF